MSHKCQSIQTLTAIVNVVLVMKIKGKYEEAEVIYRQSLKGWERGA